MKRFLPLSVFSALLLLFGAGRVCSQVSNGTIVGTAFDPSAAVVPQAKVTLTNINTGYIRTVVADAAGNYVFTELVPGLYQVKAEAAGFQTLTLDRIKLEVSQTVRADVHLALQSAGQAVSVTAPIAQLETQTASVGQVVTERTIQDLPLNGRDFLQLATLGSGVVPAPGRSSDAGSNLGLMAVQVSGNRADENSYMIDGIESSAIQLGGPSIMLSPDAIQEFSLLKNSFDARYGQASAVVSMVTKSGGNSFHGTAYEFLRNQHLDSTNFFDNAFGRKNPIYQQNQFGASAGGPIIKNKLFFFGNYEGLRVRQGNTLTAVLPTQAQLGGDLSGLLSSKVDPGTGNKAILDPFTGQPFPNNMIPASRISNAAKVFSPYMPQPNAHIGAVNYLTSPSKQRNDDQFTTRIDANLSSKDTMYGRFVWYNVNLLTPGLMPLYGATTPYTGETFSLNETHTFSPAMINSLMLGFDRGTNLVSWIHTPNSIDHQMGITNIPDNPSLYGLPDMSIAGYSGLGGFPFQGGGLSNTYQITEELSWIHGRHDISFGADLRRIQYQAPATSFANGVYVFDGRYSGNALADYLLGTASAATIQQISEINNWRASEYAFFAQDSFRVSPRFTLNLGIRYEGDQPYYEINGKEGFFDTSTRKIVVRVPSTFSSLPIPSSQITYDPNYRKGIWAPYHDFAPRVGFAYQLFNNTTLRAGYGIFFAKTEGNQLQGKANVPPLAYTASLTGSLTTPNLLMGSLFPSLADQALGTLAPFSVDPNDRRPYSQQWNFGFQHRFGSSILAEAAYVGNKATHLVERVNINQAYLPADPAQPTPIASRRPYQGWGDILGFNYGENSSYNSLQLRLEKRFSNGLSFLSSYTWSHALDTSSGADVGSASAHQNMHDLRADYASSDFNIPQRFTYSFTYELPFGTGRRFLSTVNPIANKLVGGWQVNGIVTFAEGYTDNVVVSGDRANTGADSLQRADLVAGCSPNLSSSQRTIQRYFNTSCFTVTPLGTYGTAGRNIIRVPGTNNWDMSLFKTTALAEKVKLQLRAEFFNAWNHTQLGGPVLNVQSPTFGQILSAAPPRLIQLGAKFLW